MPNATDEFDFVLFELLAGSATETETAPRQLVSKIGDGDRKIGGQTLDNHHQRLTVAFSGGQVAQHLR